MNLIIKAGISCLYELHKKMVAPENTSIVQLEYQCFTASGSSQYPAQKEEELAIGSFNTPHLFPALFFPVIKWKGKQTVEGWNCELPTLDKTFMSIMLN